MPSMSDPSAMTGLPEPQVATHAVGMPATPRRTVNPFRSRMSVRYLDVSNSWWASSEKLNTESTISCPIFVMPSRAVVSSFLYASARLSEAAARVAFVGVTLVCSAADGNGNAYRATATKTEAAVREIWRISPPETVGLADYTVAPSHHRYRVVPRNSGPGEGPASRLHARRQYRKQADGSGQVNAPLPDLSGGSRTVSVA